ncbi:uncharacterized protein A4U43_C02F4370 [Asparagus officinalis]|uniref:SAM domain-containing protein n=1 Tax=Asparagus officinalis TaxID=4686 RepID=A0A5P1FFS8_ASPOF|nr:uncharacterized protein LOC109830111 [Asparagus officinalis]ONK77225.1 uncharacterized protein A4U43_C02F4370 [Asparagus officinalis]
MYSDKSKRSVWDRLNIDHNEDLGRSQNEDSNRQHQRDDKWKHDLYDDREPHTSKPRVGPGDLRFELQTKASQQAYQRGKGTGVGDLRENLSGRKNTWPIKKSASSSEATVSENKRSGPTSKKPLQESNSSVDAFLQSIGLKKYLPLFEAEEIDEMTVLVHLTEEDLKDLGLPMGPRKKILLALDSGNQ